MKCFFKVWNKCFLEKQWFFIPLWVCFIPFWVWKYRLFFPDGGGSGYIALLAHMGWVLYGTELGSVTLKNKQSTESDLKNKQSTERVRVFWYQISVGLAQILLFPTYVWVHPSPCVLSMRNFGILWVAKQWTQRTSEIRDLNVKLN